MNGTCACTLMHSCFNVRCVSIRPESHGVDHKFSQSAAGDRRGRRGISSVVVNCRRRRLPVTAWICLDRICYSTDRRSQNCQQVRRRGRSSLQTSGEGRTAHPPLEWLKTVYLKTSKWENLEATAPCCPDYRRSTSCLSEQDYTDKT